MTPADAYAALSDSTDPRLMITARRLREVTVVRLPPDPRLNPKPMPPLRHAPPRPAHAPDAPRLQTSASQALGRETAPWLAPGAVLIQLAPNPKQPGSVTHTRYAGYRLGATYAELRAAGVTAGDVRWDHERGYVRFGVPTAPDAESPATDETEESGGE